LGTALSVKPILRVRGGEIVVDQFVRTSRRAVERLVEIVGDLSGVTRATVVHLGATERAARLASLLKERVGLDDVPITEASAAISAHTGEGVVGLAVLTDPVVNGSSPGE
jgi:fatty acid-binding protein DegV